VSSSSLSGYPRGWFVICFSEELPKGGAIKMRYFGEDMVAFRGDDGQVGVLEAYCAHVGAHLAVGGEVVGCTIKCPFHGWRYDASGACVEIPYAQKVPPKARQRAWKVREVNGVVLLHHDPEGSAPDYEIPPIPDYGNPDWLPWSRHMYDVKTHPREIVDNMADRAHFAFVHKTKILDFDFSVDGHTCTQVVKGCSTLVVTGGYDNFTSTTTMHGPGYLLMRMDGAMQNYMLLAHTPIDENRLHLRMGIMLKILGDRKKTEGFVGMYMDNLKKGFEDDLRIWENKVYRDPAVLCDGDGPIGKLRKWYRQFFTEPSPTV
jgi:3-ketosteroid 9alpha-monooxygenase subunit A